MPSALRRTRRTVAFWLPPAGRRPVGLGELAPATRAHRVAAALLLLLFALYLAVWIAGNREVLFDPEIQNDDARAHLVAFHRWADPPRLADDPIALEMLANSPPLVRLVYRALVPAVGLLVATKAVSLAAFALFFVAGWIVARSRRAGIAAALLLVFFALRTWPVVTTTAGGLPRSFGFPLLLVWAAGAVALRPRVRAAAALALAGLYPPAATLCLGAEAIVLVHELVARPRRYWPRAIAWRLALALGALALVAPLAAAAREQGPLYSLAAAREEPAYGAGGRYALLPFANPVARFADRFAIPLAVKGETPAPDVATAFARLYGWGPALAWAAVGALALAGGLAAPLAARALLASAVAGYALSRLFAFHLYDPERYASHGGISAAIALLAAALGLAWARRREREARATRRDLLAAATIALVWVVSGDGWVKRNGGPLDGRALAPLREALALLPDDARVGAHPIDANNVAFWSGRAATDSWETLTPWRVGLWAKQKARTRQTLRALYATRREELLSWAAAERVSHLLLRRSRYRGDLLRQARFEATFDPLLEELLAARQAPELALASPPPEAVVASPGGFLLVDLARLRATWAGEAGVAAATAPGAPVSGPLRAAGPGPL